MHDDEVATDPDLVRRLIAAQFPEWAELPISPVSSSGTCNALYRLGEDKVVRLPLAGWADGIAFDFRWLPMLSPILPCAIPEPLGRGRPTAKYPFQWGVYGWLEGENPVAGRIADGDGLALDLRVSCGHSKWCSSTVLHPLTPGAGGRSRRATSRPERRLTSSTDSSIRTQLLERGKRRCARPCGRASPYGFTAT